MNTILADQNTADMIRLQKAKTVAYADAKKIQSVEWFGQIFSLFIPIIGLLALPQFYEKYATAIAAAIFFINGVTYILGKRKTDEGANIQEQFDTQLFKINWNGILCGEQVHTNEIVNLANRYSGKSLKDWYSLEIDPGIRHTNAVLLCQDSNLIWDMDLRKKFRFHFVVFLTVYYILIGSYLAYQNQSFNHSLYLLSPTVSFLVFSLMNISNISDIISEKRSLSSTIKNIFINFQHTGQEASINQLRDIQNVIFSYRKSAEKIPDWYYEIYKREQNDTMDECVRVTRDNYNLIT